MSTTEQTLRAKLATVSEAGKVAVNHPFLPAAGREAINGLVDLAEALVDEVVQLRRALQTPGLQFPTLPDA